MSRRKEVRKYCIVLFILFAVCPAFSSTYFVDPNGNDTTGNGTIGNPWKTIGKALSVPIVAGDTIYMRAGTYPYTGSSSPINLPAVSGTSPTNRCSLIGYNGERARLDFSAMTGTSANGLQIPGSYWYVKGIDFYDAPHNGIKISGTYNTVEFCRAFENRNSGFGIASGAAYNNIINCDSYYNYDPPAGGNADGFAPKMDVGTGNYFYGCRSWQNSDDGYDAYPSSDANMTTTFENCWSFKNGYLKDANSTVHGNGNGFKMGGGYYRHNAILKNCLTFNNFAKGFDQNHNVGSMTLYNCTACNNGGNNFNIYDPLASGKTATITNCTYYSTNGKSYNLASFVIQTTNNWSTSSAYFVNTTDTAAAYGPRKADGSLPDITFMHLAAGSPLIDAGTNVGLPYNGSAPDLGCFETSGSPPGAASSPTPANGATGISITPTLSWTAGSGATSGDVYFGTSSTPPSIGNQTGTTYAPGTLAYSTTYYWRIDEKNSGGTTTGTVWSFTTIPQPPPGAASNPSPSNGAINVNLTQDLSWSPGTGATSHDVYYGTVNPPPLMSSGQTATSYATGTRTSLTTYYWRIDEENGEGTTTGTVWSFTTGDLDAPTPNPMTWSIAPNATDISSIIMTATTASDVSGVQYYFANITDPNHDSNWVSSPVWIDTGLTNNTKYSYKVKARDMSASHNETGWSADANATTPRFTCTNSVSADLNGDCQVNFLDFVILANAWAGNPPMVDLNEDGVLNFKDLAKIASNWLTCNRNPAEECWK
jgi:hypothetical protein